MKAAFLAAKVGVGYPWKINKNPEACAGWKRYEKRIQVGPWLIDPKDQPEILRLKQWLHSRRKHFYPVDKSVIAKCAARRARKLGLTESERAFFTTMFGASKISDWLNNKISTHENVNHGLQIAG